SLRSVHLLTFLHCLPILSPEDCKTSSMLIWSPLLLFNRHTHPCL
ncbi:unnamed protein product, partial [Brassica oleracea]